MVRDTSEPCDCEACRENKVELLGLLRALCKRVAAGEVIGAGIVSVDRKAAIDTAATFNPWAEAALITGIQILSHRMVTQYGKF